MEQLTPGIILVGVLLFLLVIYMSSSCSLRCNSPEPYAATGYNYDSEFSPNGCVWNSGQTCTLRGNRPGNCTLHGLCAPSFSIDQTRIDEDNYRYKSMLEADEYD